MAKYAWFTLEDGRQVYRKVEEHRPKRSSLAAPYFVADTMEATQHPCTGEYMTSKSAFRQVTKAYGCVEVGNDPARLKTRQKAKPDRKQIRDAIAKATAEYNNGRRLNPKPVAL